METVQLTTYDDRAAFGARVQPFLAASEIENSLLLGLVDHAPTVLFMGEVTRGDRIVLVAMLTANGLVLAGEPVGIEEVVSTLAERVFSVPGVTSNPATAAAFSDGWRSATGSSEASRMEMRLYSSTAVLDPPDPGGECRLATMDDRAVVLDFMRGFAGREPNVTEAERRIGLGYVFLWVHEGQPVSMASHARPTAKTITIGSVYTPPEFRNRGYASAVVAEATRQGLASGKEAVLLYTDLSNPTSNSIYQRIGYRPVCDARSCWFA